MVWLGLHHPFLASREMEVSAMSQFRNGPEPVELTYEDLNNIESGLVRQHNSVLNKSRKLRPSERAAWLVSVKQTLEKVRAEKERRKV